MDWFTNWALEWQGVFALVFMIIIATFLWRTIKLMPKTKPVQIKPDVKHAITWDDIAGVDEAKEELREIVDFLRDPSTFHKVGAKVPKGILLHGPAGTGKTLLAKAAAHESGAQFFSQSAASFVEMFAGLGAAGAVDWRLAFIAPAILALGLAVLPMPAAHDAHPEPPSLRAALTPRVLRLSLIARRGCRTRAGAPRTAPCRP